MTKTEYAKYIQSEHWQQRRKEALVDGGHRCESCDLPRWVARLVYDQDLHVHHLNYEHLGNELPEDLKVLCRRCHEIETFGRSDFREIKTTQCSFCKTAHWDTYSDYCDFCKKLRDDDVDWWLYLKLFKCWSDEPIWQPIVRELARLLTYNSGGGGLNSQDVLDCFIGAVYQHGIRDTLAEREPDLPMAASK